MIVCPTDLQRCQRPECRHGRCSLSGEHPLAECVDCGVIVVVPIRYSLCVECVKTYHFPKRRA